MALPGAKLAICESDESRFDEARYPGVFVFLSILFFSMLPLGWRLGLFWWRVVFEALSNVITSTIIIVEESCLHFIARCWRWHW